MIEVYITDPKTGEQRPIGRWNFTELRPGLQVTVVHHTPCLPKAAPKPCPDLQVLEGGGGTPNLRRPVYLRVIEGGDE